MLDKTATIDLAVNYQLNGKLVEAEKIYTKLLSANPLRDDALYGYGILCMNAGRFSEACGLLEKAVLVKQDNLDYRHNLAISLFRSGRITDARRHWQIATDQAPDNQDALAVRDSYLKKPNLYTGSALQGAHAPERQVFMSATVNLISKEQTETTHPLRILEIGSYMGSSLLTWAYAISDFWEGNAEIWCIDPWEGTDGSADELVAQYDPLCWEVFQHNAACVPENVRVVPVKGLSQDVLPALSDNSFDIIYVDGCHYYEETLEDIREADRLLKPGGVVCGDDLELQLNDCDAVFANANARADYVEDPKAAHKYHPGVTLAVGEFFGEVSNHHGFWSMRKDTGGYSKISYEGTTGYLPRHWPEKFLNHLEDSFGRSERL